MLSGFLTREKEVCVSINKNSIKRGYTNELQLAGSPMPIINSILTREALSMFVKPQVAAWVEWRVSDQL